MDHDRNFKELLSTFFVEFVQLLLPDVAAYLDPASLEFLDKEIFTDVTAGEKHEVDLIVKARFRGEDAFFLVHVENQASAQPHFPKRMFTYFARLHEKYNLPVYPVVIFSYETPLRSEPKRYQVGFPGKNVLNFEYTVIQLNRLSWRKFATQQNPVASALMAKMKIAPKDRPKVRSECLRLLATLKLDPARSRLIGGFIETYLQLSAEEMKQYEREFAKLTPAEKEATMELTTSWERKGIQQGIQQGVQQGIQQGVQQGIQQGVQQGIQQGVQQGMERVVMRLLRQQLRDLPHDLEQRINGLSPEKLDQLSDTLLDLNTSADLETWLSEHHSDQKAE